ncbi:MAG: cation-transporting P-type ATPase [Deltaproteobacteria bacterium]|nr:cation-transporting P-type ATPase [Deltaproteobacteria bacterium]MBW1965164.1 cation-transporting P-type ATPase [Deltaproteobacteria bacterium]
MQALPTRSWHHLDLEEVSRTLETDPAKGLTEEDVSSRRKAFGENTLTQKMGQGPVIRFLLQFNQPLVIILMAATLVTLFLQEWVEAGVIFGVILINAVIGFIQESKALKAIDSLARAMVSSAMVQRTGRRQKVSAQELVPGDVVFLQSGDKVPADVRLFEIRELRIDESTLTGESLPVQKEDVSLPEKTVLPDRRNMAYSSTLVTHGACRGLVIATGDHTEIGRINEMISSAEVLATPLTRKIEHFSKILLYVIVVLAAFTFLVGYLRGQDWVEMFMASVALAVGAIPEGLPAAITITLAIGVSRMAKRNAIIRKLPAVETLGSTTVICSDKTGTLTQNQMTVTELYAGGFPYAVSGVGYASRGDITSREEGPDAAANRALIEILKAGVLCNDSVVKQTGETFTVEGDPTEGAIITCASKAGIVLETLNQEMPRIDSIPFESDRQYMATLHDQGPGKSRVIYVKGAIESICLECSVLYTAAGRLGLANAREIHGRVEGMASDGLRVLAFARKEVPAETTRITHEDIQEGLTFLGIQGMIDPPRQEAMEAIGVCQKAGILVKMITGDHAGTAAAISRQLGLCSETCSIHTREVLTGRDLSQLEDEALVDIAEKTAVFARVSPEQKLRLVEALQKCDHVVAMTGDGVNDAPALKQANIGVAMGITGTDVSKEAADMVLTDDNFSTLKAAVEEGRGVFDNLIKFITWTLPTNGGEALVIMVAIFLGAALPILPLQILWINMTTALLLGLTLAFEPKEPGIMIRKPRDPKEPILTRALIFRIVLVSLLLLIGAFGLFEMELRSSGNEDLARTMAVNTFVFGEMFYLFNCRSLTRSFWQLGVFSNVWLWGGITVMTGLQALFTYSPVFNTIFRSHPMGIVHWALVLGYSALISLITGVEKLARRRQLEARKRSF